MKDVRVLIHPPVLESSFGHFWYEESIRLDHFHIVNMFVIR